MKILYLDMDNVLVDFTSGINRLNQSIVSQYEDRLDEVPGIFSLMYPMEGAIEAVEKLSKHFEIYILSTAPWENPSAWSDKLLWIKKYFPTIAYKRLILTHHKNLNKGDFLVDDRLKNGADKFEGEHIHFGQYAFENWTKVTEYLLNRQ